MNIPTLTGLFDPIPYKAPEDALENNLRTLGALQDPSGTLKRLQSEKLIAGMADLKTAGITEQYKTYALKSIQDFQSKGMDMYKQRKGLNRLTLSAEQQLEHDRNYKNTLIEINSLKELTEDYKATLTQVATDVHKEILTPQDYRDFTAELDKNIAEAKSVGDLKMPHLIYNRYLAERGVEGDDFVKQQTAIVTLKDKTLAQVNQGMDQQPAFDPAIAARNVDKLNPQLVAYFGGKDAIIENAKDTWVKQRESKTNIFMPGWQKNWQEPYVIPPNQNKVVFTQNKIKGYVARGPVYDQNGKVIAEAGDVIKPAEMEGGLVKINVIKNGKYIDFAMGDGTSIFLPSPGQIVTPITGFVPYTGEIKDQMQSMAGKPLGEGKVDPSGYEAPGTGEKKEPKDKYVRLRSFKSSDPIDPERLEENVDYVVDGKRVRWDGKTLVPAKK